MGGPGRRATYVEYLAADEASEARLEFVNGEIVDPMFDPEIGMSGGTPAHAFLGAKVSTTLTLALQGGPCRVFSADLRIRRQDDDDFAAYPDVTVVCGDLHRSETDRHGVTNPRVVVEVLSPHTERYDRGAKSAHYRRVDTVQEIVLVRQDVAHVEVHRRNEAGRFELFEFMAGEVVELASIGARFDVDGLYDGVPWEAEA